MEFKKMIDVFDECKTKTLNKNHFDAMNIERKKL
jgi:hypothetical protein